MTFLDYISKSKIFQERKKYLLDNLNKKEAKKYDKYFTNKDPIYQNKNKDREDFYFQVHYTQMKEALDMIPKLFPKNKGFSFLVVCFAPGGSSQAILDLFPKSTGHGISLHPKDGGLISKVKTTERYTTEWGDIIQTQPKKRYDLVLTHCRDMTYGGKLNYKLDMYSFLYALKSVKQDGIVILKYTFRDLTSLGNLLYYLRPASKKIHLAKSISSYGIRSTVYIVARGIDIQSQAYQQLLWKLEHHLLGQKQEEFPVEFYPEYKGLLLPVFKVHIEGTKKFLQKPYYMKA